MSRILFPHTGRRLSGLVILAVIAAFSFPVGSSAAEKEGRGVVSRIVIIPKDAISLTELKSIIDIKEGAPYSRKGLSKGIKLLYMKGRFSDISVDAAETGGNISLSFIFTLKERVGKVYISGNRGISNRRLNEVLIIEEWDELNLKAVEKQALAIKEFYRKKGYYRCEVNFRLQRPPDKKDVDIEYIIQEGERARVSSIVLAGDKAFPDQQILKRLALKVGGFYEEEKILTAVKGLERFFRKSGYSGARTDFQSRYLPEMNEIEVAVNIEEGEPLGKKVKVEKITFKGNSAISSKVLRKQMLTGRSFSEDTLAEDMDAIEFLYKKSGYLSARVAEKVVTANEDGTRVSIELVIIEGKQTIINGLEIKGNILFTNDELLRESGLKIGAHFDPWVAEDEVLRITSLYFQKGYIYARVSYKKDFTEDKSGIVLKYTITEGVPVRIGKIVIQGNDFTDEKVVRRELLIKQGDPYNPELVFKSQQRVSRLGYLGSVRIVPVEEGVVEEEKDLLLSVKERKAGAIEFGAGYGTEERFRGFAELSHRNLFGTGASARLRGDISSLENTYLLGIKKPWLLDLPVDGRFSLVDQTMRRTSYSLEKYAAIAGLDKDLSDFVKASLQYEYEISRLFDVDQGAIVATEDSGTLKIGTISPIIIRDSRDNLFNPRTGSVNSFKLDYSSGIATGSEVEFVRYILQSSWYIPFSKRIVWGLSARGGWADAYGKTADIPISKRFFLGGRTTVRGFELDSIGPKGADGSSTGGDSYLNLNTEVRFPIYRSFGGLIFADAGNAWLRKIESVDINDLRSSAGAGIRYMTPIGPLSFDIGWKLDQKPGESAWEWHFTIGNVF
ncbi:MAG: outer membrane protein assembly factor BamA [Deltaproteobacteria bacterium]